MKICFVVRSLFRQLPAYTTTHLAFEAYARGHEVAMASLNHFTLEKDGRVFAWAVTPTNKSLSDRDVFLKHVQTKEGRFERHCLNDYDFVFLRYNPGEEDLLHRQWSPALGFGRALKEAGVRVVNDPDGLARASSKMYLTQFPQVSVPSIVTRSPEDVRAFLADLKKPAILKPLHGYGGRNVFLVKDTSEVNLNQIISAATERGYLMAQEYVPANPAHDKRVLVCNGKAIALGNRWAVFQRVSQKGEIRSNMRLGASRQEATLDFEETQIVEAVGPQLVKDGLFFVGLDIVGGKLIEINVFCPGGIHNINQLYGANVGKEVIKVLEHDHATLGRKREAFIEGATP